MCGWLARRREARRAHEEQWALERVIGPDGLSEFQRRAEAALTAAGFRLREREVSPLRGGADSRDLFISGLAGQSGARVYLYQDGLELRGDRTDLRLEHWDVESPDQIIRMLIGALLELDAQAG